MSKPLRWIFPAAIVLFIASPLIPFTVDPNDYSFGRSRDEQARIERNSSSVARLFGELRSSMSDIVFLKTERYLHGGIGYTAHMEVAKSVQAESEALDAHQAEVGLSPDELQDDEEDDHSGTPTLIPPAEKDFRGIVGYFERQVRPWQDPSLPHVHTSGKELLPWYRVMTLSDPKNVRGFMIGSYWLSTTGKYSEAREFLSEGIKNNPESFQLPLYRARIILKEIQYTRQRTADENAMSSLELALQDQMIQDFVLSAELVLKHRPKDFDMREFNPQWTDYMEDDAGAAIRLAVSVLRKEERLKEALDLAERGASRLSFYDQDGNYFAEDPKILGYIADLKEGIALGQSSTDFAQ
ncbi:MAG: hypothetical protein ACFCU1_02835 [Sumerlaeia bacterium]